MKITLVTGNKNKLEEWQRLMSPGFELVAEDVDLDEIQSLDLERIVIDKAERAFKEIGGPVIVEDIAVGIKKLNDLPGPFIKFFIKQLGQDCLIKLAGDEGEETTVTCMMAYHDGKQTIIASGVDEGVTVKPRGENGFGFDVCFVPQGSTKTYAEMSPTEKDAISHRGKAIKKLAKALESL